MQMFFSTLMLNVERCWNVETMFKDVENLWIAESWVWKILNKLSFMGGGDALDIFAILLVTEKSSW